MNLAQFLGQAAGPLLGMPSAVGQQVKRSGRRYALLAVGGGLLAIGAGFLLAAGWIALAERFGSIIACVAIAALLGGAGIVVMALAGEEKSESLAEASAREAERLRAAFAAPPPRMGVQSQPLGQPMGQPQPAPQSDGPPIAEAFLLAMKIASYLGEKRKR